jgi:hyperosmotically inducible periplasmic protein
MKTKTMYFAILLTAVITLLMTSMPVYASKTDDRIESSAKKSYVFKTYLKGDDVNVQSKDGAVILTGTVAEEYHKTLAQETVADIPGVKSVDNKLEIKGTPPAAKSDGWITAKVKTTLLFHKSVSAMDTEVDTKNGIVTLRGKASSQAQKELTAEYARDVEGVKDVKNETMVTTSKSAKTTKTSVGKDIDDASITGQVKMSLLYHRSTSAINTKVTTKRGVVTVSGKAGNAAEKDLVTKLINDVHGVKSVTNKMTIG